MRIPSHKKTVNCLTVPRARKKTMAAIANFYTALIVFLAVSHVAFTLRFKIAIPEEGREALRHHLTKRSPVCDNYKVERREEKLEYPGEFKGLNKPWEKNDFTVVYTSKEVTQGMEAMFKLEVPGLRGETIKDYLESKNCLSFQFGGCVCDQFLGALPRHGDKLQTRIL